MPQPPAILIPVLASFLWGQASSESQRSSESGWENILDEEGIQVYQRTEPGTSFVAFRGIGVVDAPIVRVAAVIRNDPRKVEWMHNCIESETKKMLSATHVISYNRTASPVFFVSDRDAVVEVKTELLAREGTLQIDFRNVTDPLIPEREGIVRVPRVRGRWALTRLSASHTEVRYEVEADPGGSLPAWLVNWVSRKLPFHTILNLRAMVQRTGFDADELVVERAFDWSAVERLPPSAVQ